VLQAAKENLRGQIQSQFAEFSAVLAQLEEEFRQREFCLREAVDDSFQEMRERHIGALAALEFYRSGERIRALRRSSASVQALEWISLTLANREEFDRALAFLREAASARSQDARERVAELKRSFKVLARQMKAQVTREMAILEEKLERGIAGIREQLDAELAIQRKQCSVVVQRLMVAEIHAAIAKVNRKELEATITDTLTKFVRDIVVSKYGMNRKLTFDVDGK
jgi:hypothetical protein